MPVPLSRLPERDQDWLRLFERLIQERDEVLDQVKTFRELMENTMVESIEKEHEVHMLERECIENRQQIVALEARATRTAVESEALRKRAAFAESQRDNVANELISLREVVRQSEDEIEFLQQKLALMVEVNDGFTITVEEPSVVVSPNFTEAWDHENMALRAALDAKDEHIARLLDDVAEQGARLRALEAAMKKRG